MIEKKYLEVEPLKVTTETTGMFGIAFKGSKSIFNTQKACLKKKVLV
jgi:hypothetical protein